MKFGSVCSGIEAASVAWQPLGWQAQWFSEIEPFPCSLLKHHYPATPNLGDMTQFESWPTDDQHAIDLLCGGTPCQSFSVAGLRAGLDDPRGNLMLTFGAIAAKYRPQWLVWENVPGVLSSNGGRDFGTFLGMLGQLGYGFAYRVLDAQYFGVAQRRRRVFVVGCLGDWRSAAAVLFERHSLQGNPAPRRQAGQRPTAGIAPCAKLRCGCGYEFDDSLGPYGCANCEGDEGPAESIDSGAICVATGQAGAEIGADMAPTLNCNHEAPYVAHSLRGEGFDAGEDGTGRDTPLVPCLAPTLTSNGDAHSGYRDADGLVPMAFDTTQITSAANRSNPQPVGVTIHGTDPTVQKVASYDELAQCLRARTPGNIDNSSTTVVQQPVAYGIRTANTSSNGWGIQEECTHTLDCAQGVAVAQPVAFHPTQDPISSTDGSTHALGCGSTGGQASVAVAVAVRGREGGATAELGDEVQNCLRASSGGGDKPHGLHAMQVRRLTPEECEALQGFPRSYTAIPWRGKPADQCPDGPRYKALGNSWAVPNVRWIGRRIEAVALINSASAAMNTVAELETA